MLRGVVDIGSNTVRLTVYDCADDGSSVEPFFNVKRQLGLASRIDPLTGRMDRKGIEDLVGALDEFSEALRRFKGPVSVGCFATACLRRAVNSRDVVEEVRSRCGVDVEVLAGEEEARLGFLGAMWQGCPPSGVQLDIGGGSTEVLFFEDGAPRKCASIPWGSLSLFDKFVADIVPTRGEAEEIRRFVADEARRALPVQACGSASCVGGSARAALKLARLWQTGPTAANRLAASDIRAVADRLLDDPHAAVRTLLREMPERVHTCTTGILVLQAMADLYSVRELEVHSFGIREGYLLDRMLDRS